MHKISQTAIVAFPTLCVLLAAWAVSASPRTPLTLPPANGDRDDIQWFPATEEYLLPVRPHQEYKSVRQEDIGEPYNPIP